MDKKGFLSGIGLVVILTGLGFLSPKSIESRTASCNPCHITGPIRTYEIKKGDTLENIAKRFYGPNVTYEDIYNEPHNRRVIGNNPNYLKPGTKLNIDYTISLKYFNSQLKE